MKLIDVCGILRSRINSNGQAIHSTPAGITNFWKWFGDSIAIDGNGRPLVLYHGTNKDFDEFSSNKNNRTDAAWSYFGHFFTPDAVLASKFTKGKRWGLTSFKHPKGANVLPVYLKITNPSPQKVHELLPMSGSEKMVRELRCDLENDHHDGIIISTWADSFGGKDSDNTTGELHVPQYIVFNARQIKSALGNSGEFALSTSSLCDTGYRHHQDDSIDNDSENETSFSMA